MISMRKVALFLVFTSMTWGSTYVHSASLAAQFTQKIKEIQSAHAFKKLLDDFMENKDNRPFAWFVNQFIATIKQHRAYCRQQLKPEVVHKDQVLDDLIKDLGNILLTINAYSGNIEWKKGVIFTGLKKYQHLVLDSGSDYFYQNQTQLVDALKKSLSL